VGQRDRSVGTLSTPNEPRVVVVTGGARGIGLASARAFAADGDRVAVLSKSTMTDEFPSFVCDVSDANAVDETFAKIEAELGRPQVVVSNAGITRDALLARMKDDDWHAVLDTNLTGAFNVARRAIAPMMKARWGRLVFVSSVAAYMGGPGQANYAATKAGLIGLARSIAREYASRSITANVVTPGPIATDMTGAMGDDWKQRVAGAVPAGRMGNADEVAAAVRFLASNEAGFITGAVLPVDGGLAMGY
jgi:3-oxoacyl-[acyl-carrier protein] reductase